ncbi:hypothetical protein [Streptomyces sp. NPDC055085]
MPERITDAHVITDLINAALDIHATLDSRFKIDLFDGGGGNLTPLIVCKNDSDDAADWVWVTIADEPEVWVER